ncbi:ankyrin repeat domain-containing protein [Paraburkholderia hayleyella]|uniref:ankyrin repeat domain-containing protein n=1 Tax=Paraburkholderia hayleyella TaxID=2152889 RepID=UPI00129097EB|nr:ankyrin repeat domain-containing protein [Paraburkholderia hayleyella]
MYKNTGVSGTKNTNYNDNHSTDVEQIEPKGIFKLDIKDSKSNAGEIIPRNPGNQMDSVPIIGSCGEPDEIQRASQNINQPLLERDDFSDEDISFNESSDEVSSISSTPSHASPGPARTRRKNSDENYNDGHDLNFLNINVKNGSCPGNTVLSKSDAVPIEKNLEINRGSNTGVEKKEDSPGGRSFIDIIFNRSPARRELSHSQKLTQRRQYLTAPRVVNPFENYCQAEIDKFGQKDYGSYFVSGCDRIDVTRVSVLMHRFCLWAGLLEKNDQALVETIWPYYMKSAGNGMFSLKDGRFLLNMSSRDIEYCEQYASDFCAMKINAIKEKAEIKKKKVDSEFERQATVARQKDAEENSKEIEKNQKIAEEEWKNFLLANKDTQGLTECGAREQDPQAKAVLIEKMSIDEGVQIDIKKAEKFRDGFISSIKAILAVDDKIRDLMKSPAHLMENISDVRGLIAELGALVHIDMTDELGFTALHRVSSSPLTIATDILNDLLWYDFKLGSLEIKDREQGRTALLLAAEQGIFENVKILVEVGADVNARDIYGETALFKVLNGNFPNQDIAIYLLKHGADPDAQNFDKNKPATPAIIASLNGFLTKKGPRFNKELQDAIESGRKRLQKK